MEHYHPPCDATRTATGAQSSPLKPRPSLTAQHERWLRVQQVRVCWLSECVGTIRGIRVRPALLPTPVSLCCSARGGGKPQSGATLKCPRQSPHSFSWKLFLLDASHININAHDQSISAFNTLHSSSKCLCKRLFLFFYSRSNFVDWLSGSARLRLCGEAVFCKHSPEGT